MENLTSAITNVSSVITAVMNVIEGNVVLTTIFCTGLFVAGAKIVKRIKNAVK